MLLKTSGTARRIAGRQILNMQGVHMRASSRARTSTRARTWTRARTSLRSCKVAANAASYAPTSLRQLVGDLKSGRTTASALMQTTIERIQELKRLNAFVCVEDAELLMKMAAEADMSTPLAGLPVAIKDNLSTVGMRTTAASRTLENYVPTYDADVVARIKASGGIVVGKTNMDEFGMGSSTESSLYGASRNPIDEDRVAGGSSGGSAVAVAGGMVSLALGSDTGGSVRQPSSFCGVAGLKPTYGRVSRHGLISYGSSLDCVGMFAAKCDDLKFFVEEVEGVFGGSNRDMTSSDGHAPVRGSRAGPLDLSSVKVGVISDFRDHPVTKKAIETMEAMGVSVEEVTLETYSHGLPAYYILALSEASSNLSRYDGIRYGDDRSLFSSEVKRRILMGTYALSSGYYDAYYKKAQQVRTLVTEEMEACLKEYDFLVSPVAPTGAYKLGEKTKDPLEMYKGDLMTVNVNLSGLPAISVPFVTGGDGLPENLQVIGRRWDELRLLEFGSIIDGSHQNGGAES